MWKKPPKKGGEITAFDGGVLAFFGGASSYATSTVGYPTSSKHGSLASW